MTLTAARKRANAKYNSKAYDQIKIIVKKGKRDEIKKLALEQNVSLNQYITRLIMDDMEEKQKQKEKNSVLA